MPTTAVGTAVAALALGLPGLVVLLAAAAAPALTEDASCPGRVGASGSAAAEAVAGASLLQLGGELERNQVLKRAKDPGEDLAPQAAEVLEALDELEASEQELEVPHVLVSETDQLSFDDSPPRAAAICAVEENQCKDFRLADIAPLAAAAAAKWAVESSPSVLQAEASKGRKPLELVVARYQEDIQWLDALPSIPTVVYDRGGSELLNPRPRANLRIVQQANTGREDEVFLRHIVAHYEDLPDMVVFLQGWPFLHCPGMLDTVASLLQSSSRDGSGSGLMPISRTFYKYSLDDGLLGFELSLVNSAHVWNQSLEREMAQREYGELCDFILDGPCPTRQWVAEGAQWAVSRERIRSKPLSLYERALEKSEGFHGKLRGLLLEALWPVIWNSGSWSPNELAVEIDGGLDALPGRPTPEPAQRAARLLQAKARGQTVEAVVVASGTHCARAGSTNDEDKKGLLWSCENRMGFCELEWHTAGTSRPASEQFLRQRSRYHVLGQVDSELGHQRLWAARVRLGAPMLASRKAHHVQATSDGSIWMHSGNGTGFRWTLLDWNATEPTSTQFVLAQRSSGGQMLYLGCSPGRMHAQLRTQKVPWQLKASRDGHFLLRSSDDQRQLRFRRGQGLRLFCSSRYSEPNAIESLFSLELVERPKAA